MVLEGIGEMSQTVFCMSLVGSKSVPNFLERNFQGPAFFLPLVLEGKIFCSLAGVFYQYSKLEGYVLKVL